MMVSCNITSKSDSFEKRIVYAGLYLPLESLPCIGDEIDVTIEVDGKLKNMFREVSGLFYWIECDKVFKVRIETIPRNLTKD